MFFCCAAALEVFRNKCLSFTCMVYYPLHNTPKTYVETHTGLCSAHAFFLHRALPQQ